MKKQNKTRVENMRDGFFSTQGFNNCKWIWEHNVQPVSTS